MYQSKFQMAFRAMMEFMSQGQNPANITIASLQASCVTTTLVSPDGEEQIVVYSKENRQFMMQSWIKGLPRDEGRIQSWWTRRLPEWKTESLIADLRQRLEIRSKQRQAQRDQTRRS